MFFVRVVVDSFRSKYVFWDEKMFFKESSGGAYQNSLKCLAAFLL
jgi:hypothetical protein